MSKEFKKVLHTVAIVLLYQVLINAPIWFVKTPTSMNSDIASTMNVIGGSNLGVFTYLALGLTPYFMASIVIDILSSGISPTITRWKRTRNSQKLKLAFNLIMFAIATIQSIGLTATLEKKFWCIVFLVAGSFVAKHLADIITKRGICNGTMALVSTNIITSMLVSLKMYSMGPGQLCLFIGYISVSVLLSIFYLSTKQTFKIQYDGENKIIKTDFNMKAEDVGISPIVYSSITLSIVGLVSANVEFVKNILDINHAQTIIMLALVILFCFLSIKKSYSATELIEDFEQRNILVNNKIAHKAKNEILFSRNKLFLVTSLYMCVFTLLPVLVVVFFPNDTVLSVINPLSLLIVVITTRQVAFNLLRSIRIKNLKHY